MITHNNGGVSIFGGIESKQTFSYASIGSFAVRFRRLECSLVTEEDNFTWGLYTLSVGSNPDGCGNRINYARTEVGVNQFRTSISACTITNLTVPWGTGVRHDCEIIFINGNQARLFIDGTQVANHTTDVGDANYKVFINQENEGIATETIKVDLIYVRKYATPEPSVTIGTEEAACL